MKAITLEYCVDICKNNFSYLCLNIIQALLNIHCTSQNIRRRFIFTDKLMIDGWVYKRTTMTFTRPTRGLWKSSPTCHHELPFLQLLNLLLLLPNHQIYRLASVIEGWFGQNFQILSMLVLTLEVLTFFYFADCYSGLHD